MCQGTFELEVTHSSQFAVAPDTIEDRLRAYFRKVHVTEPVAIPRIDSRIGKYVGNFQVTVTLSESDQIRALEVGAQLHDLFATGIVKPTDGDVPYVWG